MTHEKRTELIDNLFEGCREILTKKGKDYSGDGDALSNFKRNADRLGMTKYQVWAVYASKHWDSILNSIKARPEYPQVESEPLAERIKDAINYLAILHALVAEDLDPDKLTNQ